MESSVTLEMLFKEHCTSPFPREALGDLLPDLAEIDAAITGCAESAVRPNSRLTPAQLTALQSSRDDMVLLVQGIPPAAQPYFRRLLQMAQLMLHRNSTSA